MLIHSLHKSSHSAEFGGKANHLAYLIRRKHKVPETYVCDFSAYQAYLQGRDIDSVLRKELSRIIALGEQYAVRSSANIEDSAENSFAGQFLSKLNLVGVDSILSAIHDVWDQTRTDGVIQYLERNQLKPDALKMGVIIQKMVTPVLSGVVFTKNPITGLNETIVEAVPGSGETLVQSGETPLRWVQKWGTWLQQPETNDLMPAALADAVVKQARQIAGKFGKPVDLEWVYDGTEIFWVQLREITTLDVPFYSNRISKEVYPGLIKPLVWSINTPLVNGAWVRLFTEMIGPNEIDPMSLAKRFYGRAYFNMGALGDIFELLGMPREALELLTGLELEGPEKPKFKPSAKTFFLFPRLLWFLFQKRRFAHEVEQALDQLAVQYQAFYQNYQQPLKAEVLWETIVGLYEPVQQGAYFNITLPLLMYAYNGSLKSQLKTIGVDFAQVDLYAGMPELDAYDPPRQLEYLAGFYRQLPEACQRSLDQQGTSAFLDLPEADVFEKAFHQFMDDFGHFSDSGNDFSVIPWRHQPETILKMIQTTAAVVRDEAVNQKTLFEELSIPFRKRWLLRGLYRRARKYHYLRQWISSLYTFGYGLYHEAFTALGQHLVDRDVLSTVMDVFYLSFAELEQIITGTAENFAAKEVINSRKAEMASFSEMVPPETIFGDEAVPLVIEAGEALTGIPTSRGVYTGTARVLTGIEQMHKLGGGEILVIPFSDVGWTPLFTNAGAVVAESGGVLSHSSIIAREYKIPAVVSVSGACQVLDGQQVMVDGFQGKVTILKN